MPQQVIVIAGPPLGKPRQTQRDRWKRRPCVVRYRCWADLARASAAAVFGGPPPPAHTVSVLSWRAFFAPPPSWSKRRRAAALGTAHRAKPDRDNIDKAVLDALYPEGDAAIAAGWISKQWDATPRLEVTIEYNPEAEIHHRDAESTEKKGA